MHGTRLNSLPAGIFDKLTSLEYLILESSSSLSSLPAGIFDKLTKLTLLSLYNNSLSSLPAGIFDKLTSLEQLYLSHNSLSSLPAGIFDDLTSLRELSLSNNSLSSLPAGIFDKLTSLRELLLYNNSLSSLPAGIFDKLTSLRELSLDNNSLSSLPAGIFDNLTSLRELSLYNNILSSLPAGIFDKLTKLTWLELGYNNLSSLPVGVFDKPTSLRQLLLYNNNLSSLPVGVFDKLTSLNNLELYNNSLSSLPAGVFDKLTSLNNLRLDNNSLSSLPAGVFDKLTSLRKLSLHNNSLSSLQPGVFDKLTSMYYLDLRANGLACLPSFLLFRGPRLQQVNRLLISKFRRDYRSCGVFITESSGTTQVSETAGADNTDTYTVALDSEPISSVTITVTSGDTGAAAVSPATLTFTASNWDTAQTVTVSGMDDNTDNPGGGREVSISHSATSIDPDYNGITIADVTTNVVDDEDGYCVSSDKWDTVAGYYASKALTLTGPLYGAEWYRVLIAYGQERTYRTLPEWDMERGGIRHDRPKPTTPYTAAEAAEREKVWGGWTPVRETLECLEAVYGPVPQLSPQQPQVDAGMSITESDGATQVTEAAGTTNTDTYTVALNTEPIVSVTVEVVSSDSGAATVSPATLTFSTSDWNSGQTVTVTGVDDFVAQGSDRSVTISHSAASRDGNYDGIAIADVSVTVVDDDTPGVRISESGGATAVSEAAGAVHSDSYTVALDTRPSSSVTVEVISGDSGAATVSPATLTFSTTNWNSGQTVTVTGVDDFVAQGSDRSVTISHSAASRDGNYDGIAIADVNVTVVDDDSAGVSIIESDDATSVTEAAGAGHTDSYVVKLATLPTGSVTVAVASGAPGAATVAPATLTFTPANWDTAQPVTVSGVDDNVDQSGNRRVSISHSAASSDANYDGIAIADVTATVVDDDTAGVSISQSNGATSVSEAAGVGHSDDYTVVLNSEPTSNVTVEVVSGDSGAATVSPATLTFNPTNWNTVQPVTVSGVDDHVDQRGSRSVTIAHQARSTDTAYDGISILPVSATVTDDDTAGVRVIESDGFTAVSEAAGAGQTDTYTVVLTSEPTHGVRVTVASGTPGAALVKGDGTTAGATSLLSFTPSTWSTPQTVTVSGVDDNVDQSGNRSVSISHSATSQDPAYEGISIPAVSATVMDDGDGAGVRIIQSGGATVVTEAAGVGQRDSYTVALTSEPTHGVRVTVVSGTPGAALVKGGGTTASATATLTFTPSTWSRVQTVTVTGVDDSVNQGGNRSARISHRATSQDPAYEGISIPWVGTTVVDDDTAGVRILQSDGATVVTEAAGAGQTDSYTVALTSEPTHGVRVTVVSGTPGAALVNGLGVTAGATTTLTFTPSTWSTPQTVTVTGVDDKVNQAVNRSARLEHSASSTDPVYDGISIPWVSTVVVDDENAVPDTRVVDVTSGSGASIAEGGSATFTFTATPAPVAGSTMRVSFTMTGAPFRKRTSGAGHSEGSASAPMGGTRSSCPRQRASSPAPLPPWGAPTPSSLTTAGWLSSPSPPLITVSPKGR